LFGLDVLRRCLAGSGQEPKMETHPYGWLSLLPPVVAVVTAMLTRRIVPALLLGIFAGCLLMAHGSPLRAIIDLCELHLWNTLIQPDKLRVCAFTLLIGATIGVIQSSGGMRGLIQCVAPLARNRRTGQLGAWLMGLLVFFDDYANCLLLGTTLAPLCDRLRISREKLAYIVDSTAAPVAGLALVSTWIAVELDYLREGLKNIPEAAAASLSAFDLFIACIPYRFYVIQTLVIVFLIGWLGRDFGPMLRAERAAWRKGKAGEASPNADEIVGMIDDGAHRAPWWVAAIPIFITLLTVLVLIYLTGKHRLSSEGEGQPLLWRDIFGAGDSPLALMYGGLVGLFSAIGLTTCLRLRSWSQVGEAAGRGARLVLPALVILWLASTLSRMTSNHAYDDRPAQKAFEFQDHRLYTGDYLKEKLLAIDQGQSGSGQLKRWLPTIIFVLASVISFCTGTSYGTMGILIPMVVPLAYSAVAAAGVQDIAADPIFLGSLGSVLAGAIFGDHCSPISDTTILSSQASGCNHLAHVRTQLPYAGLGGAVSILLGTVGIGFGFSVWLLLLLQTFACWLVIRGLGQTAEGG
jgi:Na+/H+ antiporter NhaC